MGKNLLVPYFFFLKTRFSCVFELAPNTPQIKSQTFTVKYHSDGVF